MNDSDFLLVKKRLQVQTGIDLDAYKGAQVRRRLDGYLSRLHLNSWSEFAGYVAKNPDAVNQLRDFLAINVSSFFRDQQKWVELRDGVLPRLCRPGQALTVWSAACSHGAEPYSLAMLLQENPACRRFDVLGTDIDSAALAQARAGGPYAAEEVKNVPLELMQRYFQHQATGYFVNPGLRSRVRFAEMDLLQPGKLRGLDLVVCRNVLIYFTEAAKRQVLANLSVALRPGGILFIGATETIGHEQALGLERIGISFYQQTRTQ